MEKFNTAKSDLETQTSPENGHNLSVFSGNGKADSEETQKNANDVTQTGGGGHGISSDRPTSYFETLAHLFKGNIGPGLYGLGEGFKNGGIILAPILTVILGAICVHSQHLLLNCSKKMRNKIGSEKYPDFADTVGLCFEKGPPKLRKYSSLMKMSVNVFLCVTQLGFCCVYFVFVTTNLSQIWHQYNIELGEKLTMTIILVPILLTALITNLKFLVPISTLASICMLSGSANTMYYMTQDLPSVSSRNYVAKLDQLPLFFGAAIFAFEGISLILPLQNSMKKPQNFYKPVGVLNVGWLIVGTMFTVMGWLGYLKYGEEVQGSLTLNLPQNEILAQSVKVIISTGVLLGYALQFFVAIQIMWPSIVQKLELKTNLLMWELVFRTFMVFVTFAISLFVPNLGHFISLIGALCSSSLALVFPPFIDLVVHWEDQKGPGAYVLLKNITIMLLAFLGFLTGSYESMSQIIKDFKAPHE